ncbi:hypothetical protein [Halpernia frigidisoli]|uniref:Uncharacterized protein n=1 Tax=Halpernia frigidisoli TaxID=1125876 RepID=A0A1I3F1G9_9FLAO|nr:hypothetical protein [Halpernia frigidisoli]SFI05010.1 hypothetical protein SAMN05443292_1088 [Halpernia frigidisoli]
MIETKSKHLTKLEKHKLKIKRLKKENLTSKLGCLFYVLGIFCLVYSGRAFNFSIFEFKYFAILTVCFGVSAGIILDYIKNKKITLSFAKTWEYLFLGNIMFTIIFLTNKYGSMTENYTEIFPILSKQYLQSNKGVNSVEINCNGITQEILLPNIEKNELANADKILIELNKGILEITSIKKIKLK